MSLSLIGLALTLLPSILVFRGDISLETHRTLMFVGTLLWLTTAPFWLGKGDKLSEEG